MPIAQEPNYQLCTFDDAESLAERLREIGVSVSTIIEIGGDGVRVDTTADNYENDGELYQYVAKIWDGPEQSLAITDAMFKQKGYNTGTFTKLATSAGKTNPDSAIMALHGVARAVNTTLTLQMED